jgi:hypothetical protein
MHFNLFRNYIYINLILNYLKKVIRGATIQENLKTNTKTMISSKRTRPQEPQGCQKKCYYLLNKLMEVWCTNIESKLKKVGKTVRKQAFLTNINFTLDSFLKFLNSSAKTQQGPIHIDLNKDNV